MKSNFITEFVQVADKQITGRGTLTPRGFHKTEMYKGLSVLKSVGQGRATMVPWIAFLGHGQRTTHGIYPCLLYYKDVHLLISSYCVSATIPPSRMWPNTDFLESMDEYFESKGLGRPPKYGNSYIFNVYNVPDELNDSLILSDLDQIINVFHSVFVGEPKKETRTGIEGAQWHSVTNVIESASESPGGDIEEGPQTQSEAKQNNDKEDLQGDEVHAPVLQHFHPGQYAIWLYRPDDGLGLEIKVPCEIDTLNERDIGIRYYDSQQALRKHTVDQLHLSHLAAPKEDTSWPGRTASVAGEVSWQDILALEIQPDFSRAAISWILDKRLPLISDNVDLLIDPALSVRTYNVGLRDGWLQKPGLLSGKRLSDLLKVRDFGVTSLLNLLSVIKPWLQAEKILPSAALAVADDQAALKSIREKAKNKVDLMSEIEVKRDDARFGRQIAQIDTKAASFNGLLENLANGLRADGAEDAQRLWNQIEIIRLEILGAVNVDLYSELQLIVSAVESRGNAREIICDRYGFSGQDPKTLADVGSARGLTRERVRQIVAAFDRELRERSVYAPVLDKALADLKNVVPCPVSETESFLSSSNPDHKVSLLGALKAAELFGRKTELTLIRAGAKELLVSGPQTSETAKLLSRAKRSVTKMGVGKLSETAIECSIPADRVELFTQILTGQPDFFWIDKSEGLFWFAGTTHSRFISIMQKILCVCPRIGVLEFKAGLRRHHRTHDFNLQSKQILQWCRHLSFCRIQGDEIISASRDPEQILEQVELTMYRLLKNNGGLMARDSFEAACAAEGIKRGTFYSYLTNSPILRRHRPGIYALRGNVGIDRQSSLHWGHASENRFWMHCSLDPISISQRLVVLPREIARNLDGRYQLTGVGDTTVFIQGGVVANLIDELMLHGAEAGESIYMLIDPVNREIAVRFSEGEPEPEDLDLTSPARADQDLQKTGASVELQAEEPELTSNPIRHLDPAAETEFVWESYGTLD